MPKISTVEYFGDLRTEAVHLDSGERIITDAPKDNEGKGEAFSPTDLVATSLASCMITIMGIKANQHDINIIGTKAEIVKEMAADPRRIQTININIYFPQLYSKKEQQLLERSAFTCPVINSLGQDVNKIITFHYN
ncbi:MAG: OsmC family protein [Candidatus Marinimicrobia bacterium]|nr:OsmC family protein [Candidatus Neomarinimicrobiota bacterium]MBL7010677.1 OsmC family protein [Candidatus Neomarinimicrobiota bacterium]MBL7031134.1 OsmC family protein [Candidatus Neomarinimicrobiota bacterium]